MGKIGVILVSIVILLLASALFYYASRLSDDDNSLMDSYNVRKEDLYASQRRIEQSLYELNQTLQLELETQKILTEKITELSAKADLPAPVINTTKVVQQPPTTVVTQPSPRPVTRAS